MRVLLTGAGGFWGQHARSFLDTSGIGYASMGISVSPGATHFHLQNILDEDGIRRALIETSPSVIMHLAGASPPSSCEVMNAVNVGFVQSILNVMESTGFSGRLMAIGSAAEYGPVPPNLLPVREEYPAAPISFYGKTKLEQSERVLAAGRSGQDVTVLRAFNLIGTGMPRSLLLPNLAMKMQQARHGRVEVSNLDSTRDFLDIKDACRLLIGLSGVCAASGKIVNCCTQREFAVRDLAGMVLRELGHSLEIVPNEAERPDPTPRSVGSTERLFSLLGQQHFKPLEQSVAEILKSMRSSPCQV